MTIRLEPLIEPTPEAIVVGDPRRAFALAQAFTTEPRMSHLARGLWGYVGKTPDGRGLTVQSTGAGGPAVAAVLSDLADSGVETAVRLGTCESVRGGPEPGRVALVTEALAFDGTGRAIAGDRRNEAGAPVRVLPDGDLTEDLRVALGDTVHPTAVSSHDLIARLDRDPDRDLEAEVRDLQTAAFLAVAASRRMRAAAILIVVEDATGRRLSESEVEEGLISIWPGLARTIGKQ